MCSHPCTNTNKKILLIDTNVLIYTKIAILKKKFDKISKFWEDKCKEYCCVCEKGQIEEEFFAKEKEKFIKNFFYDLIKRKLLFVEPYAVQGSLIRLERNWKKVIDELKKLKNNDEKGLARLVKLCKKLIDSGCDKQAFEFFTYDKKGSRIIYHKLGLQISNKISHDLWQITQLPPNWPEIFIEILKKT